MQFEYDPYKSEANRLKHGIDFIEAQALWDDPGTITAPVFTHEEPRFLAVGQIAGVFWTAVITYRGENTRIISVRRSRKNEVQRYAEHNQR